MLLWEDEGRTHTHRREDVRSVDHTTRRLWREDHAPLACHSSSTSAPEMLSYHVQTVLSSGEGKPHILVLLISAGGEGGIGINIHGPQLKRYRPQMLATDWAAFL